MVKKWEIYFADLDPTQGSEQKGIRPVLVISNDAVNTYLPVCTIIPFSSYQNGNSIYPTEIFLTIAETGLPKDSILMLQQIRTVAITRLNQKNVYRINDEAAKEKINDALAEYFEL
jgi:Growth inhibitor